MQREEAKNDHVYGEPQNYDLFLFRQRAIRCVFLINTDRPVNVFPNFVSRQNITRGRDLAFVNKLCRWPVFCSQPFYLDVYMSFIANGRNTHLPSAPSQKSLQILCVEFALPHSLGVFLQPAVLQRFFDIVSVSVTNRQNISRIAACQLNAASNFRIWRPNYPFF